MKTSHLSDFSWYRGNLSWLPQRTIHLTVHGSHAYGTNLPTSDLDLRGVAVAPAAAYLGNLSAFEQAEVSDPIDAAVFDLRKFFKLAAECNPNIIEILFVNPKDHVALPEVALGSQPRSYYWREIQAHRHLFVSQKAKHTFSGYAVAQMKRIRSHRRWLLTPPTKQPERADYGLPEGSGTLSKTELGLVEARVRKAADVLGGEGYTKDRIDVMDDQLVATAISDLNLASSLVPIIINERRYGAACRTWSQYQTWKVERNPARQEMEAKFGFDCKHAMHLVRLMRMAAEILRGDGVLVRRPDAEELLAIRNGDWTFERLETWSQEQEAALPGLAAASPLPREPDRPALDRLLVRLVQCAIQEVP